MLQRFYRSLQDPENVAAFQRLCGVQRVDKPRAAAAAAEEEECHPNGELGNGAAKQRAQRRNSLSGEVGSEQHFIIGRPLLHLLFTLGTELGNELFYISFFPFWIWNVDPYVGRRVVILWVWVMYLGQSTKDVIRWPRPASPPVTKLEVFYNSEYGMPSTHAMSGTAIPLCLLALTLSRWQLQVTVKVVQEFALKDWQQAGECTLSASCIALFPRIPQTQLCLPQLLAVLGFVKYPFVFGLLLAVAWCSLVCLSRVYMGMHSILDVVAGVFYAVIILIVFLPALDIIDNFNITYKYSPLIIISVHLALGIFSFTLDTWSTSRGDTAEILGCGAGVACGSYASYKMAIMTETSPDALPFTIPPITVNLFGKALLRVFIGLVIVLPIRAIMKMVTIPLACKVFNIPCDDIRLARQRMEVELPYRYITYGVVGFSVVFIVPYVFSFIGLQL